MHPDCAHHAVACRLRHVTLFTARQGVSAEVRGHDDDRVLEVHGAALSIGQTPVIEHLQQCVEEIRVGLLNLVEQDHLIGATANSFGQRAAFIIADIAGRRANQAGNRVLLGIFRHVEPQDGRVVLEHEFGEGLCQLCLADAGRTDKQEGTYGPVGILQARPRTPHGI